MQAMRFVPPVVSALLVAGDLLASKPTHPWSARGPSCIIQINEPIDQMSVMDPGSFPTTAGEIEAFC